MSTKKTKPAPKQSAARQKTASKNSAAGKAGAADKSKTAGTRAKFKITVQDGAGASEPVVYETLRERVNAVDANVGETESLSDFLGSRGW